MTKDKTIEIQDTELDKVSAGLITAADAGGGPHIQIFSGSDGADINKPAGEGGASSVLLGDRGNDR